MHFEQLEGRRLMSGSVIATPPTVTMPVSPQPTVTMPVSTPAASTPPTISMPITVVSPVTLTLPNS